jgi:hypothetical protein
MLNASVSPSASAALGTKLYRLDALTAAGAVPEIVGARFVGDVGGFGEGAGPGEGCAVPEAGADSSSPPPPQPLNAAALKTMSNNPGPNPRMTITPVWRQPRYRSDRVRRTGGFASPPLGGFAVE